MAARVRQRSNCERRGKAPPADAERSPLDRLLQGLVDQAAHGKVRDWGARLLTGGESASVGTPEPRREQKRPRKRSPAASVSAPARASTKPAISR